jgi:hypothetical protein
LWIIKVEHFMPLLAGVQEIVHVDDFENVVSSRMQTIQDGTAQKAVFTP